MVMLPYLVTGNSYGCEGSHCCVGCGPQEQFYGCADVSVGSIDSQPHSSSGQLPAAQNQINVVSNQQSVGYIPQNTYHVISGQALFTGSGSRPDPCTATPQYRANFQYADKFCLVQCGRGNCPSQEYCTPACRRLARRK